jgi:hypothetical protein
LQKLQSTTEKRNPTWPTPRDPLVVLKVKCYFVHSWSRLHSIEGEHQGVCNEGWHVVGIPLKSIEVALCELEARLVVIESG